MKLWATIQKDIKILLRDKIGLALMFGMPVILVIIVTSIQNNTFDLLNKTKVSPLICNKDTGAFSAQFIKSVANLGMFKPVTIPNDVTEEKFKEDIGTNNAVLGI